MEIILIMTLTMSLMIQQDDGDNFDDGNAGEGSGKCERGTARHCSFQGFNVNINEDGDEDCDDGIDEDYDNFDDVDDDDCGRIFTRWNKSRKHTNTLT